MQLLNEQRTKTEIESLPCNNSFPVDPKVKPSWSVSYSGNHVSKNASQSELHQFPERATALDARTSSLNTGKAKTSCSCSSSNNSRSRQGSAVVMFDCSSGGTVFDESGSINHADVLSGSQEPIEREPMSLTQSPVGPNCCSSSFRSDSRQQNTQQSLLVDLCVRRTATNDSSRPGQTPRCRGDAVRRQSATNDRMDLEVLSNSSGSECLTNPSKSLDRNSLTIVQCNSTVV
jgi:hypothetical protein